MKKLNKKGFTLIELLAVIVILAVVMLIAVTAVTPLMAKSRKAALADEGLGLISAGELAYQAAEIEGNGNFGTSAVCFDLEYLFQKGYFKKGSPDEYTGSVLIAPEGNNLFWISNGSYSFNTATGEPSNYQLDHASDGDAGKTASRSCGTATKTKTCSWSNGSGSCA